MLSQYYRMLNPGETIKNAMPGIIEAFVSFYGEEKRDIIESKFKEFTIIPLETPDSIHSILIRIKNHKTSLLKSKFLEEIKFENNKSNELIFFDSRDTCFDYLYGNPINNLKLYLNGNKNLDNMKSVVILLNNLGFTDVTEYNLDDMLASDKFSFLQTYVSKFDEILSEYEEENKKINSYEE